MDRILTRKDHEGNAVVFLPDSLKDGKLLAWYGQSSAGPEWVTMEYYKSTKDLEEKEANRLKKQYEKSLASGAPVYLMQRLPRGLLKAFKEAQAALKQDQVSTPQPQTNTVSAPLHEAEKAHYRAMRAERAGRVWKVIDENGETCAILSTEDQALRVLEQSLTQTMH